MAQTTGLSSRPSFDAIERMASLTSVSLEFQSS